LPRLVTEKFRGKNRSRHKILEIYTKWSSLRWHIGIGERNKVSRHYIKEINHIYYEDVSSYLFV